MSSQDSLQRSCQWFKTFEHHDGRNILHFLLDADGLIRNLCILVIRAGP
jgi:hypothetical protein